MKLFRITPVFMVIFLIGFWGLTSGLLSADPTDDLSLYLAHAPARDVYRLMSEKKVSEVLADRLDLFPKSLTPRLAHHLLTLCKHYRFDPAFILSLIEVESGFHVKVVSTMGAVGLMQLMPATAQHMVDEWGIPAPTTSDLSEHAAETAMSRALTDPFFNITMGVSYLSVLRDRYRGKLPYYLLAAYNVGPAKMDDLLSRKAFKPDKTAKYYNAIRQGVPGFRYYHRKPIKLRKLAKKPKRPVVRSVELTSNI